MNEAINTSKIGITAGTAGTAGTGGTEISQGPNNQLDYPLQAPTDLREKQVLEKEVFDVLSGQIGPDEVKHCGVGSPEAYAYLLQNINVSAEPGRVVVIDDGFRKIITYKTSRRDAFLIETLTRGSGDVYMVSGREIRRLGKDVLLRRQDEIESNNGVPIF